jgi:hypothetical protein
MDLLKALALMFAVTILWSIAHPKEPPKDLKALAARSYFDVVFGIDYLGMVVVHTAAFLYGVLLDKIYLGPTASVTWVAIGSVFFFMAKKATKP